jgi:hypothetical protein
MSYMRSLEGALGDASDVEASIPFWEFLDIEFDPTERCSDSLRTTPCDLLFHIYFNVCLAPAIAIEDELGAKVAADPQAELKRGRR